MAPTTDRRRDNGGASSAGDAPPRASRPRRADAERSIAAIIDAGITCFSSDPDVSMTAIARAAGVGRVTLYAHFPSREELLEAVLAEAIARANHVLDTDALAAAPDALGQLIRSSWRVLDQYGRLRVATQRDLSPAQLRRHHDSVLARVTHLIARGQEDGHFRTDLPRDWLVATVYSLLHTAAEEVDAGRLPHNQAPDVLEATILAALAARPATPAASAPTRAPNGADPASAGSGRPGRH